MNVVITLSLSVMKKEKNSFNYFATLAKAGLEALSASLEKQFSIIYNRVNKRRCTKIASFYFLCRTTKELVFVSFHQSIDLDDHSCFLER